MTPIEGKKLVCIRVYSWGLRYFYALRAYFMPFLLSAQNLDRRAGNIGGGAYQLVICALFKDMYGPAGDPRHTEDGREHTRWNR